MTEHLLFTLYAPLGAWGSASSSAAGQARKLTELEPSRSALVGMLAAAMGWRRERLAEVDRAVRLAVRVDMAPRREPHPDYHTVTPGVPPRGREPWTRFEELRSHLSGQGKQTGSILSWREFWSNGLWTVAAVRAGQDGPSLAELHDALEAPRWPLFAGRKAFTLGLPPDPALIDQPTLAEAFAAYGLPWTRHPALRSVLRSLVDAHRETGKGSGDRLLFEPEMTGKNGAPRPIRTVPRRDRPDPAVMGEGTHGPWVVPRWQERTRVEAFLPRGDAA